MSSKENILNRIRNRETTPTEHPSLEYDWIRYENPTEQFSEMVAAVGGTAIPVSSLDEIRNHLETLPAYRDGKIICSRVEGLREDDFDWEKIQKPHDLQDVDFAIFTAELGVAENGAVWVTDNQLKERVFYVLPQHLACVISAGNIVNNMHEAYDRIQPGERPYGLFISGPSKTADIEQSLVIGAHGARSLTVYVLND